MSFPSTPVCRDTRSALTLPSHLPRVFPQVSNRLTSPVPGLGSERPADDFISGTSGSLHPSATWTSPLQMTRVAPHTPHPHRRPKRWSGGFSRFQADHAFCGHLRSLIRSTRWGWKGASIIEPGQRNGDKGMGTKEFRTIPLPPNPLPLHSPALSHALSRRCHHLRYALFEGLRR